jgi:hypothetical protein
MMARTARHILTTEGTHNVPFDFYSWHTYAIDSADPYDAVRLGKAIRGVLDAHGFPKAESILSEWNLTPDFTEKAKAEQQGIHNAAYIGTVLSYLQDAPIDHAHFYRGDAAWMGLFDLQRKYFKTAYAFKAMSKMLDTPQRLPVEGTTRLASRRLRAAPRMAKQFFFLSAITQSRQAGNQKSCKSRRN